MRWTDPDVPCSCKDDQDCIACSLSSLLNCRMHGLYMSFLLPAAVFLASGMVGLYIVGGLTNAWWPLFAYAGILILFFTIVEIRILCRHCPFYARRGRVIRCPVNFGLPRIWRYSPEPLSRIEGMLVLMTFSLIGAYPIVLMAWALGSKPEAPTSLLALILLSALALAAMSVVLVARYCVRCINFSCPLNRVPKEIVRRYLSFNPAMNRAWGGTDS